MSVFSSLPQSDFWDPSYTGHSRHSRDRMRLSIKIGSVLLILPIAKSFPFICSVCVCLCGCMYVCVVSHSCIYICRKVYVNASTSTLMCSCGIYMFICVCLFIYACTHCVGRCILLVQAQLCGQGEFRLQVQLSSS